MWFDAVPGNPGNGQKEGQAKFPEKKKEGQAGAAPKPGQTGEPEGRPGQARPDRGARRKARPGQAGAAPKFPESEQEKFTIKARCLARYRSGLFGRWKADGGFQGISLLVFDGQGSHVT